MRFAPLLSGLVFTCLFTGPLSAQTILYTAVVGQIDAEVRCKPGDGPLTYATNRLRAGDRVAVVEERPDGWTGIVPPEGSFSYINMRYLQKVVQNQCNWMVVTDPQIKVPVIVGSALKGDRPTVEGMRLERGAQVRSHWEVIEDSDGKWLPIEPPAGEVRYVRTDTLRRTVPLQAVAAAVPQREMEPTQARNVAQVIPASQSTFNPAPAAPAPRAPRPVPENLWSRAQQAERAGRIDQAIDIYNQLYRENYNTDRPAADWAVSRAAYLKNGQRPVAARPATPVVPTNNYTTYPPQTKLVPLQTQVDPPATTATAKGGFANPPTAEKPAVQLTSRVEPGRSDREPSAQLHPPTIDAGATSNQSLTVSLPANPKLYNSGPGTLVRAGRSVEKRQTYRLDTGENNPTLYVTAGRGIDLEQFLNQKVELIGEAEYSGELRANHMRVNKVQPLAANP